MLLAKSIGVESPSYSVSGEGGALASARRRGRPLVRRVLLVDAARQVRLRTRILLARRVLLAELVHLGRLAGQAILDVGLRAHLAEVRVELLFGLAVADELRSLLAHGILRAVERTRAEAFHDVPARFGLERLRELAVLEALDHLRDARAVVVDLEPAHVAALVRRGLVLGELLRERGEVL